MRPGCMAAAVTKMNVLALFSRAEQLPYKIPCSQVQEVDKAVCLQKTDLAKDDVAPPVNIHPCMFTTLVWDNID